MRVRTRVVAFFAAVIAVASGLVVAEFAGPVHATDESRPNVVVIEVDDMRADDMWVMSKTRALLPGTEFTNSFVSTSLCCPSRAGLLSGQYATNNKALDNSGFNTFNHSNTLATWLQARGYFTSLVGKYMNRYSCTKKTPPNWDHWQALCAAYTKMFGYKIKDRNAIVQYGTSQADYQTDVLADRAVATVGEADDAGKPLFLWVTPTAPHTGGGVRWAARHATALSSWRKTFPASYNEADVSDKPAWVRALKPFGSAYKATIERQARTRLRMLLSVDDLVEDVVEEVKARGQFENTIFIFTSDNGYMMGEHRMKSGKLVGYAESLRVPLLISGPGIPVGTNAQPVLNTDLAATISELTGATPGRVMDGRSFVDVLTGSVDTSRRALFHTMIPHLKVDVEGPISPGGYGVQVDRFVYLEHNGGDKELYDHSIDPYELQNLAGQPRWAAVQAQLAAVLQSLRTCAGASCRVIVPNIEPVADGAAVCDEGACTFDGGASLDAEGEITHYAWDFGDGATATGKNAAHAYEAYGSYTATLTVTDDEGATATKTFAIEVVDPNPPTTTTSTVPETTTTTEPEATTTTTEPEPTTTTTEAPPE